MADEVPFIGLAKERQRLALAFHRRESVLLLGNAGSGKTRLLRETCNDEVLFVRWQPSLHSLLVTIARGMIGAKHSSFLKCAKIGRDAEKWLAAQPSIHLKGLLWTAIEDSPVPIALDGIAGASFPVYRFLQRIYHAPGMAILAASRDAVALGALSRLFWNPSAIVRILPLNEGDARLLFDVAADHFGLRTLDLADFRDKVLESAQGNPGQIVEMCRLATRPQYVSGRYIKFAPLRIDTMIKFAG